MFVTGWCNLCHFHVCTVSCTLAQDVVFSGVSAVGIGIGFIVTAANAADFQRSGNGNPRDAAAATSVSASVVYVICDIAACVHSDWIHL